MSASDPDYEAIIEDRLDARWGDLADYRRDQGDVERADDQRQDDYDWRAHRLFQARKQAGYGHGEDRETRWEE